jgi:hypothetical protein
MQTPPIQNITQKPLVAVGQHDRPSPRLVATAILDIVNGTNGTSDALRGTALQTFGGILAAWGTQAPGGSISVSMPNANLSQTGVAATEHIGKAAEPLPKEGNYPYPPPHQPLYQPVRQAVRQAGKIAWPTPEAL